MKVFLWILTIFLVLGYAVLILQMTNIFPNRAYHRLEGVITEPGVVSGVAIQLASDGGLAVDAEGGLGLSPVPSKSILANASADQTSPPRPLQLPTNSVLVSDQNGLAARTALLPSQVLMFDGVDIKWGDPSSVASPSLATAHVLVGSDIGVATPQRLTGDLTMDSSGVTTIVNNAVTGPKLAPGAITNDKIRAGRDRQVLTSFDGEAQWRDPEFTRMIKTGAASSSASVVTVLGAHTFDISGLLLVNGHSVDIEVFGQCSASATTVAIGIMISDGNTETPYLLTLGVSSVFIWKLTGYVVRSSSTTGAVFITIVGEEVGTSRFLILGLDWSGDVSVSVVSRADASETSTQAVTCFWSSATVIRPFI